jgi:hypothetical protein
MPQYTIEARSLSIVGGVAGHDFWVLRDENGRPLAELHGLATDRQTGRPVPIGDDPDRYSLRVWHYPHDPAYAASLGVPVNGATYIRDDQPSRTVLTGSSTEVLARWNTAVRTMGELNGLDLNYPGLLTNSLGDPVNSNSTYRTLGEIMGVQVRDFPGRMEPGVDNRMISEERIAQLRTHGYPIHDTPHTAPLMLGQALRQIETLHPQIFATPEERERAAGTIAARAAEQGMTRIDQIVVGAENRGIIAVQINPGNPMDVHRVFVDRVQAIAAPVQQSQEHLEEIQRQQQTQLQSPTQQPPTQHHPQPSSPGR